MVMLKKVKIISVLLFFVVVVGCVIYLNCFEFSVLI